MTVSDLLRDKIRARVTGDAPAVLAVTDFSVEVSTEATVTRAIQESRPESKEPFMPVYNSQIKCVMHYFCLKKATEASVKLEKTSWKVQNKYLLATYLARASRI